jgi:hypothetical protein
MSNKWVLVPVEPTPEMLEPMAREDCKHDGFDPDEPMPPHGHYPRWYDRCGPFAEIYRAMLAARPAAPAQSGVNAGIEAAARLLDEATDRCRANEAEHYGRRDGALATVWKAKALVLEQQAAAIRALKRGEG